MLGPVKEREDARLRLRSLGLRCDHSKRVVTATPGVVFSRLWLREPSLFALARRDCKREAAAGRGKATPTQPGGAWRVKFSQSSGRVVELGPVQAPGVVSPDLLRGYPGAAHGGGEVVARCASPSSAARLRWRRRERHWAVAFLKEEHGRGEGFFVGLARPTGSDAGAVFFSPGLAARAKKEARLPLEDVLPVLEAPLRQPAVVMAARSSVEDALQDGFPRDRGATEALERGRRALIALAPDDDAASSLAAVVEELSLHADGGDAGAQKAQRGLLAVKARLEAAASLSPGHEAELLWDSPTAFVKRLSRAMERSGPASAALLAAWARAQGAEVEPLIEELRQRGKWHAGDVSSAASDAARVACAAVGGKEGQLIRSALAEEGAVTLEQGLSALRSTRPQSAAVSSCLRSAEVLEATRDAARCRGVLEEALRKEGKRFLLKGTDREVWNLLPPNVTAQAWSEQDLVCCAKKHAKDIYDEINQRFGGGGAGDQCDLLRAHHAESLGASDYGPLRSAREKMQQSCGHRAPEYYGRLASAASAEEREQALSVIAGMQGALHADENECVRSARAVHEELEKVLCRRELRAIGKVAAGAADGDLVAELHAARGGDLTAQERRCAELLDGAKLEELREAALRAGAASSSSASDDPEDKARAEICARAAHHGRFPVHSLEDGLSLFFAGVALPHAQASVDVLLHGMMSESWNGTKGRPCAATASPRAEATRLEKFARESRPVLGELLLVRRTMLSAAIGSYERDRDGAKAVTAAFRACFEWFGRSSRGLYVLDKLIVQRGNASAPCEVLRLLWQALCLNPGGYMPLVRKRGLAHAGLETGLNFATAAWRGAAHLGRAPDSEVWRKRWQATDPELCRRIFWFLLESTRRDRQAPALEVGGVDGWWHQIQ